MGKIIFSGIGVTDIRGKVGGNVFSKNKGGAFIRNRVVGTNPGTSAQISHRAKVSLLSSQWRSLTDGQRTSWIGAAASGDWDRTDSLGNTYQMTGQQLFVSLNVWFLEFGSTRDTPPTPLTIPTAVAGGIEVILQEGALSLFTVQMPINPEGENYDFEFWATGGMSPGINRPPQSLFRRLGYFNSIDVRSEYDIISIYSPIFPIVNEGEKVFLDVFIVVRSTGQKVKLDRLSGIAFSI